VSAAVTLKCNSSSGCGQDLIIKEVEMKIKVEYPKYEYDLVSSAVKDKLTPNAYSYEGDLERIRECVRLQSELIAQLTDDLVSNNVITLEQLQNMLGYGYTVEE
jgi:hypothetical protein